ncbi:nuclear transport factor 2 family protein [Streptomyces phaeochromogenes]|uniref:nuclear transport factor 2 family protein n=1 Tax=Streptomyces phaeochromogenes TaxID=1923 RepID=UPI0036B18DC6
MTIQVGPATEEISVANVLYEFARLADEGTVEEIEDLLAPDMVWEMTGTVWRGRAEVVSGLASLRELGYVGPGANTRHIVTNQQVTVEGEQATSVSRFLLVGCSAQAEIRAVGGYQDRLRRVDDRWLMAHRIVQD